MNTTEILSASLQLEQAKKEIRELKRLLSVRDKHLCNLLNEWEGIWDAGEVEFEDQSMIEYVEAAREMKPIRGFVDRIEEVEKLLND